MIKLLLIPAYWPLFTTAELRRFDYSAADGSAPFTSVFSYDRGSNSMLYNNYDGKGVWLNKWYYQYRTGFGIAEWRDDYPNNKKVVLSPPIGWGEWQTIGSTYINNPKFDFVKCWPPAFSNGTQIVSFEQLLPSFTTFHGETFQNVLVFSYLQAWDGKPATGARYWMAEAIGPVACEFLTQDALDPTVITTSARMDACISKVNA